MQTASDLGGRLQAGSGAARFSGGGDVRVMGKTRVECKYTENEVYTLKYNELEKLRKQAIKALEYPVFQFAYKEPSGRMEKYAVIQWNETELPHTSYGTESKSMGFRKNSLRAALSLGTVMVTFHVKGETSLRSRYFQILSWDDFVDRQGADA